MNDFDAIILGSGHNSLILQAYLARAGLSTLCLERRETIGGGLATIEYPEGSGYLHNTHSFYHRGVTRMPWYRDLELQRHGAEYLTPELNVALLQDGGSIQWWTDFEKTYESFAAVDCGDAETLLRWRNDFQSIVREILIAESQSPPLPPDERERRLQQSADGRLLLDVSRLSPLEFVLRNFRNPTIQAGLLFFNGLREVDLRRPGFGHHIPALLASDTLAQMCVGGARQLALALEMDIGEHGGQFRTATLPRRILLDDQRVRGVRTENGEEFHARYVVSGLNPQQTFLELFEDELPSSWAERAVGFRYNLLAPLFALNLNLREPPAYRNAEHDPRLNDAFMVIAGLDHADQFDEIVRAHELGRIPSTVMWGSCPTKHDERQSANGGHTAFMWEKLPYRLNGDPRQWEEASRPHGEKMLQRWRDYAPNLENAVEDWFVRSPLDVETTLWNMKDADLLIGAFDHGQTGYHRPFPGAGHYRGCFEGLYLCGSCCHPGGNITGLPGYNCAQVISADLSLPFPK